MRDMSAHLSSLRDLLSLRGEDHEHVHQGQQQPFHTRKAPELIRLLAACITSCFWQNVRRTPLTDQTSRCSS
jgi:hypothetical protein